MGTIYEERDVIRQLKKLGDSYDAKQVYAALKLDAKVIKNLKSVHEILKFCYTRLNIAGVHLRNRGAGRTNHRLNKTYLELSDAEKRFTAARKHVESAINVLE